jgi:tetratricopeptide (TPR) repeat protein
LDVDLYVGEPERAAKRLEQAWPALKGTLSLFQSGRIEILTYRARIALALAACGDGHALKQAADAATRLEREGAEWASAFAVLIRAGIAQGRGRTAEALDLLTKAQRRLSAADMRLYAAAAAYRRGQLTGGDQGRAIESGAVDVLLGENVVAPLHMVGLLCPGPWESRATVPLGATLAHD